MCTTRRGAVSTAGLPAPREVEDHLSNERVTLLPCLIATLLTIDASKILNLQEDRFCLCLALFLADSTSLTPNFEPSSISK